jgi:hypothetical protein
MFSAQPDPNKIELAFTTYTVREGSAPRKVFTDHGVKLAIVVQVNNRKI